MENFWQQGTGVSSLYHLVSNVHVEKVSPLTARWPLRQTRRDGGSLRASQPWFGSFLRPRPLRHSEIYLSLPFMPSPTATLSS